MKYGRIIAVALALALPASFTPWTAVSAAPATVAAPAAPTKAPPATTSATASLIDINSASEAELAAMPQIGPVRAKAIIAGRPYLGKDELVSKRIISQSVYEKIRNKIIARQ